MFQAVLAVWAVALALTQGIVWYATHVFSFGLLLIFLLLGGCLWGVLFRYFQRQSALLEQAVQQIQSCLDGNPDARLDCDREGELYRLFHAVNALVAVLSAHADNEQREKRFLKNTIADISHQLKTPLAALNIYNGLLQDEAVSPSEVKEFADLSEQELDRIETLVQNLLKITRLDAGSVVLEKKNENVAEMVQDIARQYHYRAKQEQKKLVLSGSEAVTLWCDRDWMQEAVDNLVKNALDHTKSGDTIQVEWNALPSMVQIKVRDNGSGMYNKTNPIRVGDTITVNGVPLTVVGAFSQGIFSDDVTIIAPETLFRRVAGEQNYNMIGVQLDRTASDETVLALAAFSSDQIVVQDLRESNRQDRGTYYAARIVLYGFLAIIGGISLLNIVNSISMSVSARMKQYGILRAIGMDDAQLKRMISAEAGTYAVSGLVVGIALGLVLNRKLYILLITHYFGAAWQMPWGCLAVIVVVVLAAVVLAVYNPVRRILMQPITATISEL